MFERILGFIFRRHYWRTVAFDQIGELYTSRLLMIFASNIINLFAAVYLYKLGYSLVSIGLLYGSWIALRIPFSVVSAKYVAYFGPKHSMFVSSLIRIFSLISFALVPFVGEYAFWAVVVFGALQNMSMSMYDIGYLVNFSKVKNDQHAGKEIGTMAILEKVARVISPLIGGLLATIVSPEAAIIIACVAFAISSAPLFRSVEPTRTRNRLKLRGFPWRLAWSSLVSETAIGFDAVATTILWPLFIAVFVFVGMGEEVYASLGGLASLGVLVSVVAAWMFGRIVDKRKGDVLLVFGVVAKSLLNLFRPFVATAPGVMGVNIASETATSAFGMPFTRVIFDVADSSGFRIAYIMWIQIAYSVGALVSCVVFVLAAQALSDHGGMMALFFAAACYQLVMLISARAAR